MIQGNWPISALHFNVILFLRHTFFENFESLKNVGLAEKLINAGAKIDAFGGSSLSTPLHLAASYEDTEMVKMLLEYGADPFKKDGDGKFSDETFVGAFFITFYN